MWVVVTSGEGKGRVGKIDQLSCNAFPGKFVEVQLGTDGPTMRTTRRSLMLVAPVVKAIEEFEGCHYRPEDDR